jgi:hypothetical protein
VAVAADAARHALHRSGRVRPRRGRCGQRCQVAAGDAESPGANLLLDNAAALTQDFGLTTKQITELINYCKRSDLIIAVRQRSSRAAQLIREGLAVAKNEVIKIKAVNSIDTEFLGYSTADANTVVWASPVSKEYVEQKLTGASQEVRDVVLQRYETRVKEWKDPSIARSSTTQM